MLAATLHASPDAFRQLVENRDGVIDAPLLLDVVAALVREFAIDPHWLLRGSYDESVHREALMLRKDNSEAGTECLRNFVRDHFRRGRT